MFGRDTCCSTPHSPEYSVSLFLIVCSNMSQSAIERVGYTRRRGMESYICISSVICFAVQYGCGGGMGRMMKVKDILMNIWAVYCMCTFNRARQFDLRNWKHSTKRNFTLLTGLVCLNKNVMLGQKWGRMGCSSSYCDICAPWYFLFLQVGCWWVGFCPEHFLSGSLPWKCIFLETFVPLFYLFLNCPLTPSTPCDVIVIPNKWHPSPLFGVKCNIDNPYQPETVPIS